MLPARWTTLVPIAGLLLLATVRWAGLTLLRWELGGVEALANLPLPLDGDDMLRHDEILQSRPR